MSKAATMTPEAQFENLESEPVKPSWTIQDVVAVMPSCEQRHKARSLTLPQFEAIGIHPHVFFSPCAPAGPIEHARISAEALTWAVTLPGPLLYLEDDIDLAGDFTWHLEQALALDAIVYLYLNDTPARLKMHLGTEEARRIMTQKTLIRGPRRILKRAALFGTQCVLIPERLKAKALEMALSKPYTPLRPEPFDGRLHLWLNGKWYSQAEGAAEEVFTMIPHPVQHRQDRTMKAYTERVMRSLSFGVPYLTEAGDKSHTARVRPFSIR